MGILKGVLAAIAALPPIINAIRDLVGFMLDRFGPDWPKRVAELHQASLLWSNAQSEKERDDAAKALAAAFNSKS